jgi:hypothetical protein
LLRQRNLRVRDFESSHLPEDAHPLLRKDKPKYFQPEAAVWDLRELFPSVCSFTMSVISKYCSQQVLYLDEMRKGMDGAFWRRLLNIPGNPPPRSWIKMDQAA